MAQLSLDIIRSVQKRYHSGMMKWHYEHGLVLYASLLAAEKYNDRSITDWVYSLYDPMIGEDGSIRTYRLGEYNLDQINAGRALFILGDRTGEERFRKAQDILREQLRTQPRCLNGVYWHKEIYPWQIWLDGLYMEGPFNAEYGYRHGDGEEVDDVISQLLTTYSVLKDDKTGLLYHAFDESRGQRWSNEITGCSPHFWSRSIGWYLMALIDVLDYRLGEYNLDQINAGRALFILGDRTGEERFRKAQDILREQLRTQPRCLNGVYWHKEIYPWQIWLDGLYMEGPFNAEYGYRHGDGEEIDDVISQLLTTYSVLKDDKTGLLYHAFDESRGQRWSNEITGCSPHFWSRSIGWYLMALIDVLDYVAEDNERRGEIINIIRALSSSLLPFQDASGMWYQVPDLPGREGNYLETSATSMFAYSFYKGVRKGYLDPSYLVPAAKAVDGIKKLYLTKDGDEYHLGGICSVAGLGGNPYRDGSFKYYIKEKIATDDFKGVGPFILALLESEI